MSVNSIHQGLANYERSLNILGYIPGLSGYSGAFRIMLGKVQILAGIFFSMIRFSEYYLRKDQRFYFLAKQNLIQVIHGAGNVFRGYLELCPYLKILNLIYDFSFRLSYSQEEKKNLLIPLFRNRKMEFLKEFSLGFYDGSLCLFEGGKEVYHECKNELITIMQNAQELLSDIGDDIIAFLKDFESLCKKREGFKI